MSSFAVFVAIVLGSSLGGTLASCAQETPEKIGVAIVSKLVAGQFSEITAAFTPEMAKALPGNTLKQGWDQLTAKAGPVRNFGAPRTTAQGGITVVTVPVQFELLNEGIGRPHHHVELTRPEHRYAGIVVWYVKNLDAIEIRQSLAIVVGILLEDDAVALAPFDQTERS